MTEASEEMDAADRLRRQIAINNERAKLSATALNNVAVTLFAGGVALPVVALSFPLATAPPGGASSLLAIVVWGFVAASLHWREGGVERDSVMESQHLLLLLPPGMALVWAYFVVRAVRKSAAEVDAAREALRRGQSHPAE